MLNKESPRETPQRIKAALELAKMAIALKFLKKVRERLAIGLPMSSEEFEEAGTNANDAIKAANQQQRSLKDSEISTN